MMLFKANDDQNLHGPEWYTIRTLSARVTSIAATTTINHPAACMPRRLLAISPTPVTTWDGSTLAVAIPSRTIPTNVMTAAVIAKARVARRAPMSRSKSILSDSTIIPMLPAATEPAINADEAHARMTKSPRAPQNTALHATDAPILLVRASAKKFKK